MNGRDVAPPVHGHAAGAWWDPEAPPPGAGRRALRALAVAGVWAAAMAPMLFGWQRCTVAALLHHPCPGCGMTRAVLLLLEGHVAESLRMHALAVPVLTVWALFMASTVHATWTAGTPLGFYKARFGRGVLAAMVFVYGAALALWLLRWAGLFGGPVPVY
jgi:hypothetical protein